METIARHIINEVTAYRTLKAVPANAQGAFEFLLAQLQRAAVKSIVIDELSSRLYIFSDESRFLVHNITRELTIV